MPNAISTGFEAGPSTTRRHTYPPGAVDDNPKILPDFFDGSYEDVIDICQKEGRIACVILVSAEHDDDAEFKRCVWRSPARFHFVYCLQVYSYRPRLRQGFAGQRLYCLGWGCPR